MRQLALLMATDSWDKLDLCAKWLSDHPRLAWRTKIGYTKRWVERNRITYPLNLYFFNDSIVEWRGNCIDIRFGTNWSLDDIPPQYHGDTKDYKMYLMFDHLERVSRTHVREFPRWDNPRERYERGNQGIFRVQDILAEKK